jgi:hypothetical protein
MGGIQLQVSWDSTQFTSELDQWMYTTTSELGQYTVYK